MLQLLEFTFRSFWTFCGVLMLLSVVVGGLISVASIIGTVLAAPFRLRK